MAHDMQYQFSTFGEAMYVPCARSSFARVCSTRLSREVTFLALSFGTVWPQLEHWTTPVDPLPPFVRPLLARFSGMGAAPRHSLYIRASAGKALNRRAGGARAVKAEVWGHCTVDSLSVLGSEYERPGGPPCYSGRAAASMGADVTLRTRFGPDFEAGALGGMDCPGAPSGSATTRFRIEVEGASRRVYFLGACEPVLPAETDPDCSLVNPVMGELSGEALACARKGSFVMLDPQGFLRRAGQGGLVSFEGGAPDLAGVSAVKASPAELEAMTGSSGVEGMKLLRKAGAARVLHTDGLEISMLDGERVYSVRLPNRDVQDTTGAGDILGATFACAMVRERDPVWALCFAGGAVQAALESGLPGPDKVQPRGATSTNASYFYNLLDFRPA